jgi:microsomal dipeptidase-like Zn-dependent dipeptidase
MSLPFVDLHCHPSMKPYGQSFKHQPYGQNSPSRVDKSSIWHYDPPTLFDKGLQLLTGIPKFTQADCASLAYGNARIICASLYPIEKGFFKNLLGTRKLSDMAGSFITGVGKARVDYIQGTTNYFEDLVRERDFYLQLNGIPVNTDAGTFTYRIVKNYAEIIKYMSEDSEEIKNNTIFIIFSIEGLHALNPNIKEKGHAAEKSILEKLEQIKQWEHRPFFVTFAHHFYNQLCGHAPSFTGIISEVIYQGRGMREGFTSLGRKVVYELLNNKDGNRILIDIKHMSPKARQQYFDILKIDFQGENIPIIVSHGACTGLRSFEDPVMDNQETGPKLLEAEINFYDNEILELARSKGIFGIQLDERRIANKNTLKSIRNAILMNKIRHYRAELVWNQVQHIAELLDRHDMFAWDCIAIGSDFDGIINPLNGYLTAETYPHLQEYLERYAHNYMSGPGRSRLKFYNQLDPSEIVNRILSTNAMEFMRKWFV